MEAMWDGLEGLQGQLKEGRKRGRGRSSDTHAHTKSNCGSGHMELSGLGADEE